MLQTKTFDDRLHDLIDIEQTLEIPVDRCEFAEGPIWNPIKRYLTFTDTRNGGKTYRWSRKNGFSIIRPYANAVNGEAYDSLGRILQCEHYTHRVIRVNDDMTGYEVMASHYKGKELNSPNDVIVKKSGGLIYFTDPHFCLFITPKVYERLGKPTDFTLDKMKGLKVRVPENTVA